ncbi:MAG TPA: hypothetical protein ENH70_07080 [Desulfobacteraceae bacterium]|nr:hypothetical protein [Desulfobacteraceae bacterium]
MSILFYAAENGTTLERLRDLIGDLLSESRTEFIATPDKLEKRLREPRGEIDLALLLTPSREGFLELLSLHDFFNDIRIILILPDRRPDTIKKAHSLRPRFITYADSDFRDVLGVLKKMIVTGYLNRSFPPGFNETGTPKGVSMWSAR